MQKLITGRRLKVFFLFFAVTSALFLCGCSGKNDPTFNISGSWYFYPASPGKLGTGPKPGLYAFTQSTNDLTGSTPALYGGFAIIGSVTDTNLSFSWTDTTDNTVYGYTGTIFADGTMSGTWGSSNAQTGVAKSGLWDAIIFVAPIINLNGSSWNVFAATAGGTGEQALGAFTFTQSNNAVTNINNDLVGQTPQGPIVSGSITSLTVLFFWLDPASGTLYSYKGTISGGNTMTGSWTALNIGGQIVQSGTWRATKNG